MVSKNKIVTTVIILLFLSVLFSGCTGEKNIATAPGTIKKETMDVLSQNLTNSSKEENIPDIKITSFSSIYLHDNNEYVYLFGWENVPGNESNGLLNYLKNDLHIDWVENAQITRDDANKTIRVFTDENSIEIMRYDDRSILKIGDIYDLLVREENGTHNVYEIKYGNKYDVLERYYTVYDLSIRNNGSGPLYFKLNYLHLHEGDRTFTTATLEPYGSSSLEVLYDNERENKLQDTTLLPGQTVNGTVTFRVNSLYNETFLLKYKTITVNSASFEKSIEALRTADYFNYATALGIPPYVNCHQRGEMTGSYVPFFDDRCDTWANWVNRRIFETFQKSDVEQMRKSPPDNIPRIEMVYALRVIPERDLTMYPVKTLFNKSEFLVTDDTGEEIINTSRIEGMAVMRNKTYTFKPQWNLNFPGMNFSNASVVRISFSGLYFASGRLSINNQDVIMDDKLNIIVVRNYPSQFLS